ncbi:hypothetical protein BC831DRAFT_469340 [Entophlyctis helioformis]|nr:hypothetical protein BC831DRAFT_469340 [Entophlyctis helioformis]
MSIEIRATRLCHSWRTEPNRMSFIPGAVRPDEVDSSPSLALYEDDPSPATTKKGAQKSAEKHANERWDRAANIRASETSSSTTNLSKGRHKSSRSDIRAAALDMGGPSSSGGNAGGGSGGGARAGSNPDVAATALEKRINERWERAQEIAARVGSEDELRDPFAIGGGGASSGQGGSAVAGVGSKGGGRVAMSVIAGGQGPIATTSHPKSEENMARTVKDHWERANQVQGRSVAGEDMGHVIRTGVLDKALGGTGSDKSYAHGKSGSGSGAGGAGGAAGAPRERDLQKEAEEKWNRAKHIQGPAGASGSPAASGSSASGAGNGSADGGRVSATSASGGAEATHHPRPAILNAVIGK